MLKMMEKFDINQNDFDATYSAEDNKLRIYAASRLEKDLYTFIRENGFKWAPKQKLFVAPKWTPYREDICLTLAGEITPEQTTLIERAEAKAERLDELAEKREKQANAFYSTARAISERFAGGQPILVGHHSERKARKDQERIHRAMDNMVKASDAVSHWQWKAEGVERHANRKSDPKVRARRIKTLLSELRDRQRAINHAYICLDLWGQIDAIEDKEKKAKAVEHYSGARLTTGDAAPSMQGRSLWDLLRDNELTAQEVIDKCLAFHERQANSLYTARWVSHLLNRLAFERSELGEVSRFEGEIKNTTLQAFAREHGAHKPKATKEGEKWIVKSTAPLPLHVGDGKELCLSVDEWCDLMQGCGYSVPETKPRRKLSNKKQVPLINPTKEEAERLQAQWNKDAQEKKGHTTLGGIKPTETTTITQAVFSANSKGSYSKYDTIELDINGNKVWHSYKGASAEPVCLIRTGPSGASLYSPESIIILEDKPAKALPIEWAAETSEQVAEAS